MDEGLESRSSPCCILDLPGSPLLRITQRLVELIKANEGVMYGGVVGNPQP